MKLRFEVDQAACFRKGIDCPKSIVTIEVDPDQISQEERDLIADRMDGIDIHQLSKAGKKEYYYGDLPHETASPARIIAESPDYPGLIAGIIANEAERLGGSISHDTTAQPSTS
jgi:hypothetical protein